MQSNVSSNNIAFNVVYQQTTMDCEEKRRTLFFKG